MGDALPLAEVKAHLSELVQRVKTHHERVLVTVHGKPSAVLVAPEDLEALEETIAVLSNASMVERLRLADDELAHGLVEDESDLAVAMERRRHETA